MSSSQEEALNRPHDGAPGSLLTAWRAIALHPSRSLVVVWASVASLGWIIASFLLAIGLFFVAGLAATFRSAGIIEYWPGFADQFEAQRHSVMLILSYPIRYLLTTTAVMIAGAAFLPRSWGSFVRRLHYASGTWALVQPAIGGVALSGSLVRTGAAYGAYLFPQIASSLPIHSFLGDLPIFVLVPEVWYYGILVGVALSDGSAQGKRSARLVSMAMILATILALRGLLT